MILDEQFCSYDQTTDALVFDLRDAYGPQADLIRVRPWQEQVLIEHMGPSGWQQDDTVFDYPLVSTEVDELPDSHPLRRFSESLPEWARETVRPYGINQLRLLRILSVNPQSHQLAQTAPLVFWLLSECMTAQSSSRELTEISSLKRRDILQQSVGNGSKSLIKFISKLRNISFELIDLQILHSLFGSSVWSRLRHMPCMNWQVLKLFARHPAWLEYKGLLNLINSVDESKALSIVSQWRRLSNDVHRLSRVMDLPDPSQSIKRMQCIKELQHLHDTLTTRINRQKVMEFEARYQQPFPNPPIPGSEDIQPIVSIAELLNEGVEMHHCVASYVGRILGGNSFIYRVLAPQRATLEVLMTPDDKCRIGQLKLACNGKPSAETSAWIWKWMESEKRKPASKRTK